MNHYEFRLVLCACPDSTVATRIARDSVGAGLAACVNIVPVMHSIYRWQGTIEEASECLLLLKSHASQFEALEHFIRTHHPYEIPEIVAIPITEGSATYLEWMKSCLAVS